MRVHHYIKNILILCPLFFSRELYNFFLLRTTIISMFSFCLLSSCVYIFNDMRDLGADRQHSEKKKRPLASGVISVHNAAVLLAVLLFFSFALIFLVSENVVLAVGVSTVYLAMNIVYSLGLKNVPILDIAILAFGFLLRVIFGSAVTGIEISNWLYLTVLSLSFYLGLGKRRNELTRQKGNSRKVLEYYNYNFCDKNMYLCMALALTFYSLWCIDPITISNSSGKSLLFTVPIALIILMKYSLNIEGASEGDPVDVLLSDKILLLLVGIYAVSILSIIYF